MDCVHFLVSPERGNVAWFVCRWLFSRGHLHDRHAVNAGTFWGTTETGASLG
uniref:Uncharacterized protein n=1 Tax=Anguilla anguilla TaxID=7936 RepID=A0A0E9PD03_ANGAN